MQDNTQQTDMGYSSPNLYSDANGRGAVLGTLQTNGNAELNKSTLRPNGSVAAAAAQMQGNPQVGEVDDEEAMTQNEQLEVDINETIFKQFFQTQNKVFGDLCTETIFNGQFIFV